MNPQRSGAAYLVRAKDHARRARLAVSQGNAPRAAIFALAALQAAWHAEITEARTMVDLGVKSYQSTQSENERRQQAAELERAEWRKQAAQIRRRKPALSKSDIARQIDARRWNTIRRYV